MGIRRVIIAFHLLIMIFSVVLSIISSLGMDYYKYIYILSLYQMTNHKFNLIITMSIFSLFFLIFDVIFIILSLIIVRRKKKYKKFLLNFVLLVMSIISTYIYFTKYIIYIT